MYLTVSSNTHLTIITCTRVVLHNGFINFIQLSCKILIDRFFIKVSWQSGLKRCAIPLVVAWRGASSNLTGDIYFHSELFNPSLF